VSLFTELVVREDGWALYGFDRPGERGVFQRLLGASGFGPKLAIALLSLLGAERTVHSIRTRDIAALSTVSGIGRKKAERLVLELQERFEDLEREGALGGPSAVPLPGQDAVKALMGLGYPAAVSENAVRGALSAAPSDGTAELVKRALKHLATTRE
jgi:Holliday junction DNA helicase RuvA